MKKIFRLRVLALLLLPLVVLLTTNSAQADIIYVNFTNAASATGTSANGGFNSLNNAASAAVSLSNFDNFATGASIARVTGSSGNGGASFGAPNVSGAALTAGFNNTVGLSGHFTSGAEIATYRLTGLDLSKVYTFTAFGARQANDIRNTRYTLSNSTDSFTGVLAASGPVNNSEVVVLGGIAPRATGGGSTTGELDFSFQFDSPSTSGNKFGYLNAIRIDSAASIPEPSSLALIGLGGVALVTRRRRK